MVEVITEETPSPVSDTMKMSLNVSAEVGSFVRRLAFDLRLSESSITEIALRRLCDGRDGDEIAEILKEAGATLRRRTKVAA
jgi:hypothetical protein